MLTNSEIWKRIEEDYKEVNKSFPSSRILGTFLLGNGNFGKAEELCEPRTVSIVFPTIENIATNGGYLRHANYNEFGARVEIIDFRELFDFIVDAQEDYAQIIFSDFLLINPMYKKTFEKMRLTVGAEYEHKWKQYLAWYDNEHNSERLVEQLTELLLQYFELRNGVSDELFKSLTKTEEKALIYILETIGDEGNISISAAISGSGISRPVFTSLFDKLDRYGGAEIKNQGVKGTYINFYDHVISKFNIEE
jgi:hypothetical protein